jgi:hypothetical protein
MPKFEITRRAFVGSLAAAPLLAAEGDWVPLFNGRDLDGWVASESQASWKVVNGAIAADGPTSHLFYNGPLGRGGTYSGPKAAGPNFKNFELEVECLAHPRCNSGVYFHTEYQAKDYPYKGFEVQINNTAQGEGNYRERKKTGSLYGLRDVYKQFIPDDRWFKLAVSVRGKTVQVRLDGMLVVDYTEPTPPVIPEGPEKRRYLDRGTFALQCHDPGSRALFRSVRVRRLPDDVPTPGTAPVVDDAYRAIIKYGRDNYPMVDYHVHPKGGLSVDAAIARSLRDGIQYGLAVNCGKGQPVTDDAGARKFVESIQGKPAFVAMQAEGREWLDMFSRRTVALFDYVFTDSMTWTDNQGRRMRLWIPEEVPAIPDPQAFMDTLVDRAVGIFEKEPVDIYVNPTFLPDVLAKDYDRLWTPERMRKVAAAAAKNRVAVELNDRYKLPGAAFVKVFQEAGCKFTFGTNNGGADDLGRCAYGMKMIEECKLRWSDFWAPGAWWPRAIEREKAAALKA